MGFIKHHAIVIIGHYDDVWECREFAKTLVKNITEQMGSDADMITDIALSLANSYYSFTVIPDGSKEGWIHSDIGDEFRRTLLDWIDKYGSCDYVEVAFGGDTNDAKIIRTNKN